MQRERIGIIAVCRGNVRFDCVRNRVHTRMSDQLFGHGFRKIGIDDGHIGRNFEVRDGILDALCIIGDDGKRRHFGSRTRRRGNRAEMRLLSKGGDTEHFAHFFKRDVGIFVFDPHRFRGIDRRTAAHSDDPVGLELEHGLRAFHNRFDGRVGFDPLKQFNFHARFLQIGNGLVQKAEFLHGAAAHTDHRPFSTERLQRFQRALAVIEVSG